MKWLFLFLCSAFAETWQLRHLNDVPVWNQEKVPVAPIEHKDSTSWDMKGHKKIQLLAGEQSLFEQSLDLKIQGRLKDSLWMEAHLKDSNIPIAKEERSATIQELDKIYWKIYNPLYSLELGDIDIVMDSNSLLQGRWGSTGIQARRGSSFASWGVERVVTQRKRLQVHSGQQGGYSFSDALLVPQSLKVSLEQETLVEGVDYWVEWASGTLYFTPQVILHEGKQIDLSWQELSANQGVQTQAAKVQIPLFWGETSIRYLAREREMDSVSHAQQKGYYLNNDSVWMWNKDSLGETSFFQSKDGKYSPKQILDSLGNLHTIFVLDSNGSYSNGVEHLNAWQRRNIAVGQSVEWKKNKLHAEWDVSHRDSLALQNGSAFQWNFVSNKEHLLWFEQKGRHRKSRYLPVQEEWDSLALWRDWGKRLDILNKQGFGYQANTFGINLTRDLNSFVGWRSIWQQDSLQDILNSGLVLSQKGWTGKLLGDIGLKEYEYRKAIFALERVNQKNTYALSSDFLKVSEYWNWKNEVTHKMTLNSSWKIRQSLLWEKVHNNHIDSLDVRALSQGLQWQNSWNKSVISWQWKENRLPQNDRFWNLYWDQENRIKGLSWKSNYLLQGERERPLVKRYLAVPDGTGDVVYDSLLQRFVENASGGNFRFAGMVRDSLAEDLQHQSVKFDASLSVDGKRWVRRGLLADLSWHGNVEFLLRSEEKFILPLWKENAFEARQKYLSLFRWKKLHNIAEWKWKQARELSPGLNRGVWKNWESSSSTRFKLWSLLYARGSYLWKKEEKGSESWWKSNSFEYGPQWSVEPWWVYVFNANRFAEQNENVKAKKWARGIETGIRYPWGSGSLRYTYLTLDLDGNAFFWNLTEGFSAGNTQLVEGLLSTKFGKRYFGDLLLRASKNTKFDFAVSVSARVEF